MTNPADDVNILVTRGRDLMAMESYLQALAVWRTAWEIIKETGGGESLQALFVLEEMASCLERLSRWSEATFCWSLAFSLSSKLRGDDECTITIARHTAFSCMKLKQRSRAVPYWQAALAGSTKLYGDLVGTTLFCVKHYARCLASERKHQEVLEVTRAAIVACEAGVQLPVKYARDICQSVAQAFTALQRYEEAARYWEMFCNFCEISEADTDGAELNGMRQWAAALSHQGKHSEAIGVLERCLHRIKAFPGEYESITFQVTGTLAKTRRRQGAIAA